MGAPRRAVGGIFLQQAPNRAATAGEPGTSPGSRHLTSPQPVGGQVPGQAASRWSGPRVGEPTAPEQWALATGLQLTSPAHRTADRTRCADTFARALYCTDVRLHRTALHISRESHLVWRATNQALAYRSPAVSTLVSPSGIAAARSPSRACAAEANSWDGQSQPWASMGVVRLAPVLCQCAAHPCAEPPATPSCRRLPNPTQLTSPAPAEPVPRSCSVPHSVLQPHVSGTPAEVSPTGPRCSEFREAEL
ncbi:hypothetical protein ACCO45_011892 [Purpureocillium lilacinum]|uniref:Uncharacterized protein n=1 Tax=Purpureocillium lilacinum TaxID=33203 RepID=A0ACC4DEP0_PURLI